MHAPIHLAPPADRRPARRRIWASFLVIVGVIAGIFGMQFVPAGLSGSASAQAISAHHADAHIEPVSAHELDPGDPAGPGQCGVVAVAYAATPTAIPFAIHAERASGAPVAQQANDPPRGLATEAFAQPPSLTELSIRRV